MFIIDYVKNYRWVGFLFQETAHLVHSDPDGTTSAGAGPAGVAMQSVVFSLK